MKRLEKFIKVARQIMGPADDEDVWLGEVSNQDAWAAYKETHEIVRVNTELVNDHAWKIARVIAGENKYPYDQHSTNKGVGESLRAVEFDHEKELIVVRSQTYAGCQHHDYYVMELPFALMSLDESDLVSRQAILDAQKRQLEQEAHKQRIARDAQAAKDHEKREREELTRLQAKYAQPKP